MRGSLLFVMLLLAGATSPLISDDSRIGAWDGKTASAALDGPYEDPKQADIPFGRRSYYLTPWRAYMDTWPASRYLECPGINFNVSEKEADATAQVLGEAGFRSGRVEIGWGNFRYDDPTKMSESAEKRLTTIVKALVKHGLRPLILLNANSGAPCPLKEERVRLLHDAAVGAHEIVLERTDGIRPACTGLTGMAYQTAFPLITRVDKPTGRCELSAPLPKPLKAGELRLETLKYQPFGGAVFEDGKPNAAAQETLEGWKTYVAAVGAFMHAAIGAPDMGDPGYDLEVWNEMTFGSQFLDDKNYYVPARKYKEDLTYVARNQVRHGSEIILPITADYVNDQAHGMIGVGVLSGFSNQRPWENGTEMWPGQMGFSRHYYTNLETSPLAPKTETNTRNGPLNALGKPDGVSDGKDWNTVTPGSFFIPTLTVSMPEMWHYGYKTEFMTRDVQPFPSPMKGHYRFGHPFPGHPAQVWMTEFNTWRRPWMEAVIKAAGCARDDPRAIALSHAIGAKADLRAFLFHSHKGVHTIDLFAAKEDDLGFAFLPSAFFKTLAAENYFLTDRARAQLGPQWTLLKRVADRMKSGKRIQIPRPITVSALVEHKPRLVFKGDGTAAHPDRFNRDDFACLPFQLDADRFAIGYYVVTRNMVREWDRTRSRLDPLRYAMPDQDFVVTLKNVRGLGAVVSAYDPTTDKVLPVMVIRGTLNTLTVQVPTTDTPRLLIVHESQPGPLILSPRIRLLPRGASGLIYTTNVPTSGTISYGALPERHSRGQFPVRPATAQKANFAPMKEETGIQIVVDHNGLFARWPVWGYDIEGMLPLAPVDQPK